VKVGKPGFSIGPQVRSRARRGQDVWASLLVTETAVSSRSFVAELIAPISLRRCAFSRIISAPSAHALTSAKVVVELDATTTTAAGSARILSQEPPEPGTERVDDSHHGWRILQGSAACSSLLLLLRSSRIGRIEQFTRCGSGGSDSATQADGMRACGDERALRSHTESRQPGISIGPLVRSHVRPQPVRDRHFSTGHKRPDYAHRQRGSRSRKHPSGPRAR